MKPEIIVGVISIIVYIVAILLKKNRPDVSNKIRFVALGLMLLAVLINIFTR